MLIQDTSDVGVPSAPADKARENRKGSEEKNGTLNARGQIEGQIKGK